MAPAPKDFAMTPPTDTLLKEMNKNNEDLLKKILKSNKEASANTNEAIREGIKDGIEAIAEKIVDIVNIKENNTKEINENKAMEDIIKRIKHLEKETKNLREQNELLKNRINNSSSSQSNAMWPRINLKKDSKPLDVFEMNNDDDDKEPKEKDKLRWTEVILKNKKQKQILSDSLKEEAAKTIEESKKKIENKNNKINKEIISQKEKDEQIESCFYEVATRIGIAPITRTEIENTKKSMERNGVFHERRY